MKHEKRSPHHRLKLMVMGLATALLGGLLMVLSITVRPDIPPNLPVGATGPASAPASAPSDQPAPSDGGKAKAARQMSAMLVLFSLVSFTVAGTCLVWLIVDIRRSRPAWQTQTRYPRRR